MDLFLFPQSADQSNGFSQEVWRSYQRVKPKPEDYVVWYTDNHTFPAGRSQNDFFLPKISNFHWRRFYNLFRQRPTSSIFAKDLSFLKGKNFDRIHCDDVAMYPAVRDIFPDKHITVHFHNCFLRIIARNKIYKAPLGWKFRMDLYSIKEVEHQIFRDRNTDKIFICEEDMAYYRLMTGYQDGVVWSVDLDFASAEKNRKPLDFDNKLIWFGGLESHKMFSMKRAAPTPARCRRIC